MPFILTVIFNKGFFKFRLKICADQNKVAVIERSRIKDVAIRRGSTGIRSKTFFNVAAKLK